MTITCGKDAYNVLVKPICEHAPSGGSKNDAAAYHTVDTCKTIGKDCINCNHTSLSISNWINKDTGIVGWNEEGPNVQTFNRPR